MVTMPLFQGWMKDAVRNNPPMFRANWVKSIAIIRGHPHVVIHTWTPSSSRECETLAAHSGFDSHNGTMRMCQGTRSRVVTNAVICEFDLVAPNPADQRKKILVDGLFLFVERVNNRHNFNFSGAANQDGVAMKTALSGGRANLTTNNIRVHQETLEAIGPLAPSPTFHDPNEIDRRFWRRS